MISFLTHCSQSPLLHCRHPEQHESWPRAGRAGKYDVCFEKGPLAPPPHPGTPAATRPAPTPSLRKMWQQLERNRTLCWNKSLKLPQHTQAANKLVKALKRKEKKKNPQILIKIKGIEYFKNIINLETPLSCFTLELFQHIYWDIDIRCI